jgi:hypothetical protein
MAGANTALQEFLASSLICAESPELVPRVSLSAVELVTLITLNADLSRKYLDRPLHGAKI